VTTVLRLDHVTKAFGPVKVIQDVSVDVIPGRVRVLLGENGAGKTTLIKMMSGIYHPDSGSVVIDDTPVELPTVKAAEARGIATIHQELNLVPQMSVAENIMLGRTPQPGRAGELGLDAGSGPCCAGADWFRRLPGPPRRFAEYCPPTARGDRASSVDGCQGAHP